MPKQILIWIPLSVFLICDCASFRFHPVDNKAVDPRTKAEKNFNPLQLQEDKRIITQQEYQRDSSVEKDTSQIPLQADSSEEAAYEYVTVYRVQVYTSKILGEATFFADSIKPALGSEEVHLEYQTPYYRVRIGDCKSFQEAEELMKKLKEIGLPQAWVVQSRVKTQKGKD